MSNNFKIEDFAGGAVGERINIAIKQVYENIANPNMEADKARKLTIELTFKPSKDDRTDVEVSTVVKTTLQPQKAINSRMIVESDGCGHVHGAELNRDEIKGQMKIQAEEENEANGIIDLQKQRKVE